MRGYPVSGFKLVCFGYHSYDCYCLVVGLVKSLQIAYPKIFVSGVGKKDLNLL
jgi:hypothetical protein